MAIIKTIKKGSIINTLDGFMIVTGFNGSIVTLEHHIINYEEDEDGVINYEQEKVQIIDRRLTLKEVAACMKEIGGINYKVFYEE